MLLVSECLQTICFWTVDYSETRSRLNLLAQLVNLKKTELLRIIMSNEKEFRKYPLITVVTVSYNAEMTIEKTMLSILGQTYPNIEYIVIDGGSTDGTLEIINKYKDRLAYFVSEPDKGVYDAMNKGIAKATGTWINFMNSGDTFYEDNTVEKVVEKIDESDDVIYGSYFFLSNGKMELRATAELSILSRGSMAFCHQSSFVKSAILKRKMFDTRYRICADYESFYSIWKNGGKFKKLPFAVSIFDTTYGSLSCDNAMRLIAFYENLRIIRKESIRRKLPACKRLLKYAYLYCRNKNL